MDLAEQVEADWNDAIRENNQRTRKKVFVRAVLEGAFVSVIPALTATACYLIENYNKNPSASELISVMADFYKFIL